MVALSGSRRVAITFKAEAMPSILFLLMMDYDKEITLSYADRLKFMKVLDVRSWDKNSNRTCIALLTSKFDADRFFSKMLPALENIEVVG